MNTGFCDCNSGYTDLSCAEGEIFYSRKERYSCMCMYNCPTTLSTDIHECDDNNGGCDQTCFDFPGGFNCSCEDGYVQLTEDETSCEGSDACVHDLYHFVSCNKNWIEPPC